MEETIDDVPILTKIMKKNKSFGKLDYFQLVISSNLFINSNKRVFVDEMMIMFYLKRIKLTF